jgi:hypothetical protein
MSMPTRSFRARLLARLAKSTDSAGELALALLMTAGVAHCGGATQGKGGGSTDGAVDAADGGLIVEVAVGYDSGLMAEVATQYDGGVIVEAPPPPQEAGLMVEVAQPAPDSGYDGQVMVEAPTPAPDGG